MSYWWEKLSRLNAISLAMQLMALQALHDETIRAAHEAIGRQWYAPRSIHE